MSPREKYRVIRKLDTGGMAEVFVGEAESLEGFRKRVAIKRVLPHLAQNRKFLAMFLDEARLSLRFAHANVVHTFDIGRSGDTYFVVMEYVDGTNLKRAYELIKDQGETIPVELAVFITIELCRGLAYAHDFRDSKGVNLGIVHRDVSPPNVLLSKQGEVKILDFGLAKATSQLESTDPGVVKGKFAYLSPEAAMGKSVDLRADIFACGIILFEMLTMQRLFLGENDVKTIELVRRAEVPSIRDINPDVPASLENIVRKALALKVEGRYQGCNELAEALAGFLFEFGRKVTSFDLGRLVKKIAAKDKTTTVNKPSIIDQLIQEELARFYSLDESPAGQASETWKKDSVGAAPLDPSGFEDPRTWAGELDNTFSDTPIPDGDGQSYSGAWRESGIPRRHSTPEGVELPNPVLQDSLLETASLAQMLEGEVRLSSVPPPYENKGRIVLLGVSVLAVILAVLGIAAYFLGWLP